MAADGERCFDAFSARSQQLHFYDAARAWERGGRDEWGWMKMFL